GFASEPLPGELRSTLLSLQAPGHNELHRAALASVELTRLYAQVAKALLQGLDKAQGAAVRVTAIGAHGQTVRHRPELGYTLQLLNGALLAELTGVQVVCDFRSADIAAGGQGAPLVPAFHQSVFADPDTRRAIINIGGIANLSLLAPGEPVLGCDSGPGNLLMDAWIERHQGLQFDQDGRWAASGSVNSGLLEALLADSFFALPAPKSTGRDRFNLEWLDTLLPAGVRPNDVQASLLELTARSISQIALRFGVQQAFVCGGGARNRQLTQRIASLLGQATLADTGALGVDPQAVEAIAFAWLAMRRLQGAPANLPRVTGARAERILGAVYPAPLSR
ncbi:MAG: anhydro-N-acetylmuramic acid kinase, partial [Quisquiliibacterium sp.]